jgi:hypothetical protein
MIAALRKISLLDCDRRRLLGEALLVHAAMNVLGRVSARWMGRSIAARRDDRRRLLPLDSVTLDSVPWAVQTVAARLPGSTCLTSALTAEVMLKRRGHDVVVRFGVARPDGQRGTRMFHAWVECDGRPVIGAEGAAAYRPLESCSATAARIASSTAFAGR